MPPDAFLRFNRGRDADLNEMGTAAAGRAKLQQREITAGSGLLVERAALALQGRSERSAPMGSHRFVPGRPDLDR
jgi:hypothetical protein